MSGLLGVVLALALLIWLAYRGVSVLVLGPLRRHNGSGFLPASLIGRNWFFLRC
jgi:hypothetical protein